MCQLKSGIILKNRVFVPEYDSHTEMLEELGIEDDYLNASKTFVRVELSPANGDVFSDIDTWKLTVDQDITPEWYDEDTYKPQVVEAVKAWSKDHIHIGVDDLKISTGRNHYIKDCKDVQICGNAMVENICGNATVEYIYDNATVKTVKGTAVIIGSNYGWNKKDTLVLAGNATFKDCQTKTIYQSGDWELVSVESKNKIEKEN